MLVLPCSSIMFYSQPTNLLGIHTSQGTFPHMTLYELTRQYLHAVKRFSSFLCFPQGPTFPPKSFSAFRRNMRMNRRQSVIKVDIFMQPQWRKKKTLDTFDCFDEWKLLFSSVQRGEYVVLCSSMDFNVRKTKYSYLILYPSFPSDIYSMYKKINKSQKHLKSIIYEGWH